jgi:triosephosphate isomerase
MTRIPCIAGNWKMYKTVDEAVETAVRLKEAVHNVSGRDIGIAPPFVSLVPVAEVIKGSNISLIAQNVFWEDEGAYTGEISPTMLKSAGCTCAIIGHSERRQYFGETNETVNKKISKCLDAGLRAIACIGESLGERESGKTFSVLEAQISEGFSALGPDHMEKIVIAYEPVWAIGTGKTATAHQAQEAHAFIRSKIEGHYGKAIAEEIRILYGGSVKPGNVDELMAEKDVDGALVGGASLDAGSFARIVQFSS